MFKLTYLSSKTSMSYEVCSQTIHPLLNHIITLAETDSATEYKIEQIQSL